MGSEWRSYWVEVEGEVRYGGWAVGVVGGVGAEGVSGRCLVMMGRGEGEVWRLWDGKIGLG